MKAVLNPGKPEVVELVKKVVSPAVPPTVTITLSVEAATWLAAFVGKHIRGMEANPITGLYGQLVCIPEVSAGYSHADARMTQIINAMVRRAGTTMAHTFDVNGIR